MVRWAAEFYGGRTVPKIERLCAGKVARNSFKDARDLHNLARNLQKVARKHDMSDLPTRVTYARNLRA